jgi:Flp pilus assembly pilin Flp
VTRLGDFLLRRSVALRQSADGQGYVEYLLIMVLVGLGVTAGLIVLAGGINNGLSGIAGAV